MNNNIDSYLIRNDKENTIYLYVPGSVVFNYFNGTLTDLSEDLEELELIDSIVLDLKDQKLDSLKLVQVRKETIVSLLDKGKKLKKLYSSLKNNSVKLVANDKKKKIVKLENRFRDSGKKLLDIIERDLLDLAKEEEALERFDKMEFSDEYFEKLVSRRNH